MSNAEKANFKKMTALSKLAEENQKIHKYSPTADKRKWWDSELKSLIQRVNTAQKCDERNPEGCCKSALRLLVKQAIFNRN